jgi:hypothetical protein
VVEDNEDLPDALIDAIRRPDELRAQAEQGRQQVLRLYDWDALAERMEQMWIRCVAQE